MGVSVLCGMKQNPLIGTWKLISWELKDDAGHVSDPFGPDAVGYLTYTEDGHMSVIITTARRSPSSAPDLLGGSVEEKAAAAETCVAYCGTYRIQGSKVVIHVDASLFPNWTDTEQERVFHIDGRSLTMSIASSGWSGKQQTARLLWEPA
jgi:hypothetical protein